MESFDDRFAAVAKDPRFRHVPKQERKVKIDKRFQGMFTDKRFKLKYSVDKRGRPENQSTGENLKKFYELEDSSDDEEENEEDEESVKQRSILRHTETRSAESSRRLKNARRRSGRELLLDFRRRKLQSRDSAKKSSNKSLPRKVVGKKLARTVLQESQLSEDNDVYSQDASGEESGLGSDDSDAFKFGMKTQAAQSESDSEEKPGPSWHKQVGVDLARGEGNVETSSSDSDSDDDDAAPPGPSVGYAQEVIPLTDELSHQWGELDADAPREVSTTSRLALCNMDWDSVTASDLLILLNSFKPTGGLLHSVKIYPSEFGLERMAEEDSKGPQELMESRKEKRLEKFQQEKYHMEKLRKYQLQRLKYYYAVVECDSAATANSIYEQCDGMEYETSAAKLDLRFIPDDTVFDQKPKDCASELPAAGSYKPTDFQTTALTQAKVQLTWDETDRRRAKRTLEAFRTKNVEEIENHMQAYLASSSSEDSNDEQEVEDEEGSSDEKEGGSNRNGKREKDMIARYRSLLQGLEQKEKQEKEDKEMEMEISWESGLKETTQEIVKKKSESSGSTPWEKYLDKKREKKKERKEQRNKSREKSRMEEQAEDEQAFSDDELPDDIDLSDSFFKDSLKDMGRKVPKGKGQVKPSDDKKTDEEIQDEKKRKAALELLMLDEEDDGKQHFNLKSIIDSENMSKSKRKRQLKQQRKLGQAKEASIAPAQDNFEINTSDPRFEAIFESHEYAIDPSAPEFKKTKAMSKLVTERQKRRQEIGGRDDAVREKKESSGTSVELSQLVKSVKNKTEQFHSRKKLKVDH